MLAELYNCRGYMVELSGNKNLHYRDTLQHPSSGLAKYVPEFVPWYLRSAFFLFCLLLPLSSTVGPILLDRYEMTTLARLTFRLDLGRVMDATGYLQDS